MANNKKRPEQRIIITAGVTAKGDISMSVDFVPKMPTYQKFLAMREEQRGVIAVINQFSKYNKELIAQMMEHGPDFGKAAQGAADKLKETVVLESTDAAVEKHEGPGHGAGSSQMINSGPPADAPEPVTETSKAVG